MGNLKSAEARTELQELQFKSGQLTNESLESTRRMLSLIDESQEAGLVALDHETMGELLDRIEERMDQINADLEKKAEAEKNLCGMEKCCRICVLPWKKENIRGDKENAWMSKDDDKIVASHPQLVVNERECGGMGPSPQTGYMARITNDAREVELDDNLGQMNSLLSNMRNIALDMDSELDNQKERLDRINAKGDPNNSRKDGVTKPVNNLLKS